MYQYANAQRRFQLVANFFLYATKVAENLKQRTKTAKAATNDRGLSGWGGEVSLARAPVSIGACADANKSRGENREAENGCDQCGVHTCSLVSANGACSLHSGVVGVVSSVQAVVRS